MARDKEKKKEYNRRYRAEHREKRKEYRKRYNAEHKEKQKEYQKRYSAEHPKHRMYWSRLSSWKRAGIGINWAEYAQKWLKQNRKCAICDRKLILWYIKGISPEHYKSSMVACVDHNHRTGQVRDLLCTNCNYVEGIVTKRLNGNVTRLAEYIEKWKDAE